MYLYYLKRPGINYKIIINKDRIDIIKREKKTRINMCLAIPSKIIEIRDSSATIDVYGAQRDISLLLLEDNVHVGDYVLVHAGFAIQKLQEDEAEETLKLFNQFFGLEDLQDK